MRCDLRLVPSAVATIALLALSVSAAPLQSSSSSSTSTSTAMTSPAVNPVVVEKTMPQRQLATFFEKEEPSAASNVTQVGIPEEAAIELKPVVFAKTAETPKAEETTKKEKEEEEKKPLVVQAKAEKSAKVDETRKEEEKEEAQKEEDEKEVAVTESAGKEPVWTALSSTEKVPAKVQMLAAQRLPQDRSGMKMTVSKQVSVDPVSQETITHYRWTLTDKDTDANAMTVTVSASPRHQEVHEQTRCDAYSETSPICNLSQRRQLVRRPVTHPNLRPLSAFRPHVFRHQFPTAGAHRRSAFDPLFL